MSRSNFPVLGCLNSRTTILFFTSEENLFKNQFRKDKIPDKINSIKSSTFETRIEKIALRILGRNYFDKLPIELQDRYSDYLNFIFHKEPSTADFIDKLRIDPNLLLKETREIAKNKNLSIEDQTILNQLEDLIEIRIQTQQDLGF